MDITVEELKQRKDNNEELLLIDVREEWEYEEVNMGAQNIPLGEIPGKITELDDQKDSEIIVHCRSGIRSANAQAYMQQNGFTNVRNLIGGIEAWLEIQ
jgi:rhodanese-related sulfurtransferase